MAATGWIEIQFAWPERFPMDLIFVGLFLVTMLVVVGLFARAIMRLLSFRDPTPPTETERP